MNKSKIIDLTNIGEKHSKKTEKMFKVISKKNDGTAIKAYEYKCKANENVTEGNILTYPTELLLGLKELKNNSFDISNIYSENKVVLSKNGTESKNVKTFFAEGYTKRIIPENLQITTVTTKNTNKVEKAVEKQINGIYKTITKAEKTGADLTDSIIIKEPIDTSLTHSDDVLSYPLVPLLTLNNLCQKGVEISGSYTENIDGQDYLIVKANLNKLI